MKKILFPLVTIFIISIPAIFPLFYPGFFQSDDGEWMIIRFSAFHQALRDGQIPVRFLTRLNFGYGYPVANFLYPGFMYLAEPVKFIGFGFIDSIKIILGLSIVGSGIFSFLWLRKLFNPVSAFVGCLFYIYTPYHLFDLYKRGSIGELLALATIPFIFWMIEKKNLFFISIGIFFLVLSHNTLALLFLPVLFIYSILRMSIKNTLMGFIFGILMSSFFLFPALYELQYTNFSNTQISDITKYSADVNLIGTSSFIVLFLSIITSFLKKVKKDKNLFVLFGILTAFSILLSSNISLIIWKFLPASFIQFPFRLLSYLILSISFLSAFIIFQFKGFRKYIVLGVLIIFLAFSTLSFINPIEFFDKGEGFYVTNEGTTTVRDEYMPEWVKQKPTEHFKNKVEIVEGRGDVKDLAYNSKKVEFNVNLETDARVQLNTIYYPGWKVFINGKETNINYENSKGVMQISVPQGDNKVLFQFSETPLRLFFDMVSVLSLIVLFIVQFKKAVKIK